MARLKCNVRPHTYEEMDMEHQTIEITGHSLDEARSRVKARIPEGFCVLSEIVVFDGQPVTIRESAETTDGARDAARSRIPDGSRVDHEQITRQMEVRTIRVSADDEKAAHKQAQSQLDKWGRSDVIKKVTLAIAGKRGFLGVGKKQNQYDIHAIRYAEVEIRFKPDAKISVTICQEEDRNKEVYAAFERIWKEERDKLRDSTLENVRVRPGQNWATVGAMAILQGMDNRADQSRKVALDRVATEYRMTDEELLSILQAEEGDRGEQEAIRREQARRAEAEAVVRKRAQESEALEWVKQLIVEGNVNKPREIFGTTPLYEQARSGHTEAARLLIAHGANVNACGNDGTSPLVIAAVGGHKETVALLIESGAQVNATGKDGSTALYWATRLRHSEVASLLRNRGAR
jgi:hypothetical protein